MLRECQKGYQVITKLLVVLGLVPARCVRHIKTRKAEVFPAKEQEALSNWAAYDVSRTAAPSISLSSPRQTNSTVKHRNPHGPWTVLYPCMLPMSSSQSCSQGTMMYLGCNANSLVPCILMIDQVRLEMVGVRPGGLGHSSLILIPQATNIYVCSSWAWKSLMSLSRKATL